MKSATRTVVAKTVTAPATKAQPDAALQLEFKRRMAAGHGEAEKNPSSIKEALVRWLEQEL